MIKFIALLLALPSSQASQAEAAKFQVLDLKVDHLRDPLGIDNLAPRFSWSITANARGVRQHTYQLVVRNSKSATIWNSTTQQSSASFNVKYTGPALLAGEQYWWTVSLTLSALPDIKVASSSDPATFTMGLLSPKDWSANFVGYNSSTTDYEHAIWFRKVFTLPADYIHSPSTSSALLYVASLGFCEASLNGIAASNAVLAPSTSFLPRRILYKTYNVTQLLVAGENVVGLWASAGWANYPSEDCYPDKTKSPTPLPLVMAELRVDGRVIATDGSWKARQSTISHIGPFGPNNAGYGGDVIDDRLAVADWDKATANDDDWPNATVYALPKEVVTTHTDQPYAVTCSAGNASIPAQPRQISADVIEPTIRHSAVKAATVSSSGSNHTVTMQELYTGWFEVANLQGAPNSTVTFYVSTSKDVLVQYGMQVGGSFQWC
jgi:alpha-L-rhamnosidase